jgi:hypothetical protein
LEQGNVQLHPVVQQTGLGAHFVARDIFGFKDHRRGARGRRPVVVDFLAVQIKTKSRKTAGLVAFGGI